MESTGTPGTPLPEDGMPLEAAPPVAPPPAAPPPAPLAAGAPAAAQSTSPAWLDAITSTQTLAGAHGLVYADIPSRIFAMIIDAVIMAVAFFILYSIFGTLFWSSVVFGGLGFMVWVWFTILLVIYAAGSAIYFIYTWTRLRGSPGQRVMGLATVNAADGATLAQPQAIRRWLYLFGPAVLAQAAALMLGVLGSLLSLAVLVYALYLLYSAANSPTRQGYHDVQAGSVVVKASR